MIIIILTYMSPLALAAVANDTSPSFLIGNPINTFNKLPTNTQENIILLIGMVVLATLIMAVIALFKSHMQTSAGAIVGNATMRNEGSHNMVLIVVTAFAMLIAVGLIWYFMTRGF